MPLGLNRMSVKIKPSNSIEQTASSERIEIPDLKSHHTAQLMEAVFPDYAQPTHELHANAMAYGRLAFIISSVFLLPASAVLAYVQHPLWALIALFIPAIAFISYRFGKTVRLRYDEGHIQLQKGRIFTSRAICSSYKLQALEVRQSVFTRRRNLTHVDLYTAAGKLSALYLDHSEVVAMRDTLLYAIEREERDWM